MKETSPILLSALGANCLWLSRDRICRNCGHKSRSCLCIGEMHPRTGHGDLEGKYIYIYTSTLSLTRTLVYGGWLTPRPGRFTLCKDPVPIVCGPRAGLDGCRISPSPPPPGFDPRTAQSVGSQCRRDWLLVRPRRGWSAGLCLIPSEDFAALSSLQGL